MDVDLVDADAARPVSPARRRSARPVVVIALAIATVGVGAFAWVNANQPLQRACQLAGAVGTPVASTPEGAFDAWWAQRGPDDVRGHTTHGVVPEDGRQPTKDDFVRLGTTTWEWRYADRRSIGVDVGPPLGGRATAGSWAVVGVNQCGYGPVNGGT